MLIKSRKFVLLLACFVLVSAATALDVPALSGRVNDQANILSDASRERITTTLQQLEKEKGAQVAVLTIKSLQGESLEDYSILVAEAWKLGRKDIDDGVLLLVAKDDRKIRIEVGYGLEGVLTDLDSRRIIDNIMVPAFRTGDFAGGIESAVNSISGLIKGDANTIAAVGGTGATSGESSDEGVPLGAIFFVGLFVLMMIPFSSIAVALKGGAGWFMYLFLTPFYLLFPSVINEVVGVYTMLAWLIIVPILRLFWPEKWHIDPATVSKGGSGGSSSGWSSSGGGGGFSGGGGGFGGGGASGGW